MRLQMNANEVPAGDVLIVARPHFRQESSDLYFFLSDRVFHRLNSAEMRVWELLRDGPRSAELVNDQAAIESMHKAGIIELIAPVQQENRRRVLVIEPHCDDAALSIGATMWKMRNEAEFHLLTMASRSNYSTAFHLHRDYFDRARITAMRTAEGELFTKHLGGRYFCAGLPEATLRYSDSDWSLDYFDAHEVATAISNNRRGSRAVLDQWRGHLREFLEGRTFDEIWVPLGAGTHSDHDLARNAALELIVELQPAAVIRLYEDVPYGAEFQEHTDRILRSLEQAGAVLESWSQDVTNEYSTKLSLLSIFASQFKVRAIQKGVERSASAGGETQKIERLWTIHSLPREVPEEEMWIGAPDVEKTSTAISSFCSGATTERRVAIFAISASGRWSDDLSRLRGVFPVANFVVYAGPRVCAEFRELHDKHVEIHCLDGRSAAWVKAALREVPTGHRIIIAGDTSRKAKALALLWPTGHKLICSAMDHLIQSLEHA